MSIKKSQASMEFLMTYGWALIVVLVVLAAMAYFGLLNPQRYLPEKADLSAEGLMIRDSAATEKAVLLLVYNGKGEPVYNLEINLTDANNGNGAVSPPYNIQPDETEQIMIAADLTAYEGSKFSSNMKARYSTRTAGNTLSHSTYGNIRVSVDEMGDCNNAAPEITDNGDGTCTATLNPSSDTFIQYTPPNTYWSQPANLALASGFFGGPDRFKSYIEWDLSAIPDSSVIIATSFTYKENGGSGPAYLFSMPEKFIFTQNEKEIYELADNGYKHSGNLPVSGIYSVILNSNAARDIATGLSEDWFAVGLSVDDIDTQDFFLDSAQGPFPPVLEVNYTVFPS